MGFAGKDCSFYSCLLQRFLELFSVANGCTASLHPRHCIFFMPRRPSHRAGWNATDRKPSARTSGRGDPQGIPCVESVAIRVSLPSSRGLRGILSFGATVCVCVGGGV